MTDGDGEWGPINEAALTALKLPMPGDHPGTGEPFVECRLSMQSNDQPVYAGPRSKPERSVGHYETVGVDADGDDIDEFVVDHVRTDEELAAAVAAWKADPLRHGGMVGYSRGTTSASGDFRTTSGATAEGLTSPGAEAWHWMAWRDR